MPGDGNQNVTRRHDSPQPKQPSTPSWNARWTTPARLALLGNGFEPLPLSGKRPVLEGWSTLSATAADIAAWEVSHPGAINTGILTRHNPAVDIDVRDEGVADILHEWTRDLIPLSAPELVRIGLAPKRAVLFRCEVPFAKITTGKWLDGQKVEHQLEILCDGQQIVAYGNHPDTGRAYTWTGDRPGQ
ncbi:MAG TPA: bifunctional DNA primase/polymerase, partial [Myxococcaceae bacterium]|nr:bifunctional DNA primase/polymerase [Myxococcaceae bacterium]